jgi:hypothetical protein
MRYLLGKTLKGEFSFPFRFCIAKKELYVLRSDR